MPANHNIPHTDEAKAKSFTQVGDSSYFEPKFTADEMREYGRACAAYARNVVQVEPVAPVETAWLIEYNLSPYYISSWAMFRGGNTLDYTTDSNKATRFSRQIDAQNVLAQMEGMDKLPCLPPNTDEYFKITEHMWIGAPK